MKKSIFNNFIKNRNKLKLYADPQKGLVIIDPESQIIDRQNDTENENFLTTEADEGTRLNTEKSESEMPRVK